jgi:anti-sigma regulatory factor (Ser/Thr protein kinase)
MSVIDTTVLNRRDELARVASVLDRIGADHHVAPSVLADVRIALDEVMTNIIKYGYADDAEHSIRLRFRVVDDVLETVIEDDGIAYNPLTSPAPDVTAPLHARRVGGLGVHFVKNLMNEVEYKRIGGRNRLVLKKKLTP